MKQWMCLLVIGLLFGAGKPTSSVINQPFPAMEAETVDDEVVNLPADTKGRITLVGLAYSKKSEKDLTTWMDPVFNTFIKQKLNPDSGGLFSSFTYDIDVYLIPMFTGVKAAAAGTAKRKAAKGIDQRLLPYILFYQGKLKPYKEALDFEKKDIPYFFLLDEAGKIVCATSGRYSEVKMNKIEEAIDGLE
uniref:Thioredoxin domain-containing protein n=1 Tax=Roseihalotalea indica TaxID=2867963 RepID=A0AA49GQY1_9BACT|nr:hypothetical protein K4G66_11535 [Tunicatimonas sp. TK19036]